MSFPKNRTEMRGIIAFVRVLRFASPALRLLGLKFDRALLDDTIRIGENLLHLAEKFNPVFAPRGWLACNAINTEAAKAALAAAAEDRWADADNILAEAYSPVMVRIFLNQMKDLRCFKNRMELARLALEDYEAGRFHACVPVTLALLDGMGQELTGANFFRNTRKIRATESFIEIGPGVAELIRAMSPARNTTTTQAITVPFRHGILHGTDLGYHNRIVAAKAWAALLAVGHYARDYLAPPPKPQPTLMETLRQSVETRKRIEELEVAQGHWYARAPVDLSETVARKTWAPGTPEEAIFEILTAWQTKKFGIVAQRSADALKGDRHALAGKIRRTLGPAPQTFDIRRIEDVASPSSSVTVLLSWGEYADEVILQVVYYKGNDIAPRTVTGGAWLLVSLWPLESARAEPDHRDEPDGSGAA